MKKQQSLQRSRHHFRPELRLRLKTASLTARRKDRAQSWGKRYAFGSQLKAARLFLANCSQRYGAEAKRTVVVASGQLEAALPSKRAFVRKSKNRFPFSPFSCDVCARALPMTSRGRKGIILPMHTDARAPQHAVPPAADGALPSRCTQSKDYEKT